MSVIRNLYTSLYGHNLWLKLSVSVTVEAKPNVLGASRIAVTIYSLGVNCQLHVGSILGQRERRQRNVESNMDLSSRSKKRRRAHTARVALIYGTPFLPFMNGLFSLEGLGRWLGSGVCWLGGFV